MIAVLQGTTHLMKEELLKAIESGEIDPDMIDDHKLILKVGFGWMRYLKLRKSFNSIMKKHLIYQHQSYRS